MTKEVLTDEKGKIASNEVITVKQTVSASGKGEQYYATKSGKIAKGKWVNVGLKEYYCGSNGAVKKSR